MKVLQMLDISSYGIWEWLFVMWVALIFVTCLLLCVAFLLKIRRSDGLQAAIHDIDLSYPFPPRHRPLYRELRSVYRSSQTVDQTLVSVRHKLDLMQRDVEQAKSLISNLPNESKDPDLASSLEKLVQSLKGIEEDYQGIATDIEIVSSEVQKSGVVVPIKPTKAS